MINNSTINTVEDVLGEVLNITTGGIVSNISAINGNISFNATAVNETVPYNATFVAMCMYKFTVGFTSGLFADNAPNTE